MLTSSLVLNTLQKKVAATAAASPLSLALTWNVQLFFIFKTVYGVKVVFEY